MPQSNSVIVQPLPVPPGRPRWQPQEGGEARGVLRRGLTDDAARRAVLESAVEILGHGVDPRGGPRTETGLVVGYVQSGKTLSFTTVIGLARDNGFPLVIVVAGTKRPLLKQSTERLAKDLDIRRESGAQVWRLVTNPRARDQQMFAQVIGDWGDEDLDDEERPTLLVTVLKQRNHLQNLAGVLEQLNLADIPALIIDDEADQASLNTKVRQNDESTTYRRLLRLRRALPLHTYLQYTATPQAPLLINIMSALSPSFVHVLKAGAGYVGGREFFAEGSPYVSEIPPGDIFGDDAVPDDPPTSLLAAMRVFFVGLAATLAIREEGDRRRSMLIHPSRLTAVHRAVCQWVTSAVSDWRRLMEAQEPDPDRRELVADLRTAYDELAGTAHGLPPFNEVMRKMRRALRRTQIIEFNARGQPQYRTPDIDWTNADGWILVGGAAVDRGVTVDLLSVTYMGRGLGVGNADAIQQRARFFGYKRAYLGLCRIYLGQEALSAFSDYVDHEEEMRAELQRISDDRESLKEWQRRFILSADMRPCRDSVIALGDEYFRTRPGTGWTQQLFAEAPQDVLEENEETIRKLVRENAFAPVASFIGRTLAQRHMIAERVPLSRVVDFLVDYRLPDARDTIMFTGVKLQLGALLRGDPSLMATVYNMRPDFVADVGREVDPKGRFATNFLPGASGAGAQAYPGDRFFQADGTVTLQLHHLALNRAHVRLINSAPMIAVHIPEGMTSEWVIQPRNRRAA